MTEPIYEEIVDEWGTRKYLYDDDERLHSINDLPAYVEYYPNGSLKAQHWYRFGRRHRDNDEPAVITYHVSNVNPPSDVTTSQLTSTQLTPPSGSIVAEMAWYVYGQQYERDDGQANYKYFDRNGKLREERKYMFDYHHNSPHNECGDIYHMRYRYRSAELDDFISDDEDECNINNQHEKWEDDNTYYLHTDSDEPALIRYYPDGTIMSKEYIVEGRYKDRDNIPNRIDYYLDGTVKTKYWLNHSGNFRKDENRTSDKPVLIHYKNEKPLLKIYLIKGKVDPEQRIVVYDQTNDTETEYIDRYSYNWITSRTINHFGGHYNSGEKKIDFNAYEMLKPILTEIRTIDKLMKQFN